MQKTAENRKENGPKRKGPNIRLRWKVVLGAALLLAAALFFCPRLRGFGGLKKTRSVHPWKRIPVMQMESLRFIMPEIIFGLQGI